MNNLLVKRKTKSVKSVDSGKLSFLESTRGLAACIVVFTHIIVTYFPNPKGVQFGVPGGNEVVSRLFYGLPLGFMTSGNFAVILFFILSGFVLTYKFFQSKDINNLTRQAAKRYFRLAIPIFFIVMIAYVMISSGLMTKLSEIIQLKNLPGTTRMVFNFTPSLSDAFHNAILGVLAEKNAVYNPVLWTMPVEFFGSFIVLGLAAFFSGLRKKWPAYLIAIVMLSRSYYVCFVLGMLLADLFSNPKLVDIIRNKISKFYIYSSLLIVWVLASFPHPTEYISGTIYESLLIPGQDSLYIFNLWQYLASFILLAIILIRPEIQKILNAKVLVFIGGLSFSIYLTHYLILHSLGDWLYVEMSTRYGFDTSALIAGSVTVVITLLVSMLWKKYIDDMSINVSRKFASIILK
ncbi:MAG: acyltransferase family protein [Thiobacillus sp.]